MRLINIGRPEEVIAVKSNAQRGAMLVGTAHSISLTSLINPGLNRGDQQAQ